MHGTVGTGKHDHLSKTSPPCNIHGNQTAMASLLLGKKTLFLQKRYDALNPTKNDWTYSNKLIVVHVAIVESLFRVRNKKKGGAAHNHCQIS